MNRKITLLLLGLFSFIILGMACSSDSPVETPMEDTEVAVETDAVSNVIISDIGENGNGLDLSVSFDKVAAESKVSEYRIFVIKSASASTFDLAAANSVTSENYTRVPKTGENISIILTSGTKDIDGDLLQNDVGYIVHILTIADGTNSNINALSNASNALTLRFTGASLGISITYLQNEGVLISNGEIQILIDAVMNPGSLSGWVHPGTAEQNKILNAQAPYDQIDLILVTHHHGDHFGISAITTHLNANPNTKFVAPAQVLSGFAARSQIVNFDVPKFTRDAVTVNNIKIDVLSLRHFDAFGNDFSSTINYGYLIEFDGFKILHLGDVDMTSENFDNFDLANEGIDVVIIPTFVQSVHMTSTNRDVMLNQINPVDIIAAHFLSGSIQTITNQVLAIYPDAIIFETPFDTVTY